MRRLIYLFLLLILTGCRDTSPPFKNDIPYDSPSGSHAIPNNMPPAEYTRFSFVSLELFDTVTHIMGYARSQEEFDAFVNIMYGELQRLYRLFDAFNGYSDIHNIFTINAEAGIRPVEAHPDLLDMIKTGIRAYHMTDGVVNIAIGPITAIWRTYISSGEASLPDMDALLAADRAEKLHEN